MQLFTGLAKEFMRLKRRAVSIPPSCLIRAAEAEQAGIFPTNKLSEDLTIPRLSPRRRFRRRHHPDQHRLLRPRLPSAIACNRLIIMCPRALPRRRCLQGVEMRRAVVVDTNLPPMESSAAAMGVAAAAAAEGCRPTIPSWTEDQSQRRPIRTLKSWETPTL